MDSRYMRSVVLTHYAKEVRPKRVSPMERIKAIQSTDFLRNPKVKMYGREKMLKMQGYDDFE